MAAQKHSYMPISGDAVGLALLSALNIDRDMVTRISIDCQVGATAKLVVTRHLFDAEFSALNSVIENYELTAKTLPTERGK